MAREAENIGARIKELREERHLTQRELADQLPGKTEGKDISRWENGKHRPTPDTLSAIADALGTNVADLHAGPVADRPERGPTPDPFAAATKSNGDAHAVLINDYQREAAANLDATADNTYWMCRALASAPHVCE